jgi:hypothetical protein
MNVFGRKLRLRFENLDAGAEWTSLSIPENIDDLYPPNIGFTVERTLYKEPSSMLATVHNLSADTREKLKSSARIIVTLEAGYGQDVHSIFIGDVRVVRNRREPPVLATDIEAGDGEKGAKKWARKWFPKGTSVNTVFRYLATHAGYGSGNIERAISISEGTGLPDRLEQGISIRGYALDELAALANSRGIELSVQDNEIQVLKYGKGKEGVPITVITPETGLIGYPTVDNEKIMTLNHRLLPNVFPGSIVDVKSEFVTGRYRVLRALYSGSLYGSDFNLEIEGKEIAEA